MSPPHERRASSCFSLLTRTFSHFTPLVLPSPTAGSRNVGGWQYLRGSPSSPCSSWCGGRRDRHRESSWSARWCPAITHRKHRDSWAGVTSPAGPLPFPRDLPRAPASCAEHTPPGVGGSQARPPLSTLASDPRHRIISSRKAFNPPLTHIRIHPPGDCPSPVIPLWWQPNVSLSP